jgi:hypothetical protein
MARIFLDANESRNGALAANDIVFGNTGNETVGINTGATNVRVEGTIEAVTLPGAPSAFTYRAEGNNLVVFSDGVQIARIIVQDDANGTTINFNGGSVTANVGAGGLTLGGETVPTTAGPVVPGDFDPNAQLTAALNSLNDAQDARAEFLASDEADLDDDATTPTTEADIEANLDDAQADLAAAPSAAQLNADVVEAEADLSDAQDAVDAVAGLNDAIAEFEAAEETLQADSEAFALAETDAENAINRYEIRSGDATTVNGDLTVDANGEPLIVLDDDDNLVFADGVNETRNPGVTDLLNALRDYQDATETVTASFEAYEAAQENLDLLDADPAADGERQTLEDFLVAQEAFDTALDGYVAGNAGSEAALVSAYQGLLDAGADDVADGYDPLADNAANAAAIDTDSSDVITENGETEAELQDDLVAAEAANPRYEALQDAEAALADAEDAVDGRADLVAAVEDAQGLVDQLDAVNDDVDAAVTAIEDLGFETPIILDGGTVQGTARNDIFVAAGEDATVGRFGRAGDDRLFIGSDMSLVELESGDDITDDQFGSATRLEAFIQQDGANTVIFVEEQAFQGSEADGGFDGYTITLTGVQASNVTFENGYFSIA